MAIDTSGLYFPKPRDKAGDEILSDHQWKKRRKVLYQLAGERCQKCGSYCHGEFEVHHKMKRGLGGGRRRDNIDNLLVLCIPCHRKAHGQ